ncbi:MAG: shikimate dehydrogenase [Comamonadaceae bacterium]|nr:MAG: shikimate dehydrogenase [Comamonadaceae bacterium]
MKPKNLDGETRLYGIVGDPISAVRSPEVFNAMFEQSGVNAIFVPIHVAADDLVAAWSGLKSIRNLSGLVVTMPHKGRIAPLLDEVGLAGQIVGAVNAARREPDGRWRGDMFDGLGFVDGLRAEGYQPAGWKVRLHGLGGAGAAIAVALAQSGVAGLCIQDLESSRRDKLCKWLQVNFPSLDISADESSGAVFDAVINATPLGMKISDPLPFEPAALPQETLVVDIVTKPEITPLLERAANTGHPVHSGRHMHLGQARRVAEFFGYQML